MPRLTDAEIAQLAHDAGFRGDMLNTAVAVALAESRGRTDAIGDVHLETSKWGPSVGLWQIRSLNPGYGTAREQAQRDQTANLDPATNAANAYAISGNGTSFRQWSTYTNGDYQQFLDRARAATAQLTGTGVQPVQHPAPAPAPAPARGNGNGNGQSFHARGGTLGPLAQTLHGTAGDLRTLRGALTGSSLPANAFGQIPESGQAAREHTRAITNLGARIGAGAEEIDRTATNVTTARENYLRQDRHHADQYRRIILELFTTRDPR